MLMSAWNHRSKMWCLRRKPRATDRSQCKKQHFVSVYTVKIHWINHSWLTAERKTSVRAPLWCILKVHMLQPLHRDFLCKFFFKSLNIYNECDCNPSTGSSVLSYSIKSDAHFTRLVSLHKHVPDIKPCPTVGSQLHPLRHFKNRQRLYALRLAWS